MSQSRHLFITVFCALLAACASNTEPQPSFDAGPSELSTGAPQTSDAITGDLDAGTIQDQSVSPSDLGAREITGDSGPEFEVENEPDSTPSDVADNDLGAQDTADSVTSACISDEDCDQTSDGLCVGTTRCDEGNCVFTAMIDAGCMGPQHPCRASWWPGSNQLDISVCVCATDSYCCETSWDQYCTERAAECGAVCDCDLEFPTCNDDSDCLWCDDGDRCNGTWTCSLGECIPVEAVTCPETPAGSCLTTACEPSSGECLSLTNHSTCADTDICTADLCTEEGLCTNEPLSGCLENSPCSEATTPGSASPEITACVCALNPTCCAVAWDSSCVNLAQMCGMPCACLNAPADAMACTSDMDCSACDDGNACHGSWSCVQGACTWSGMVTCDTSMDQGCLQNRCDAETGACAISPNQAACEDDDLCTLTSCNADTGSCDQSTNPVCGTNHPCVAADTPGCNDPEIESCVCQQAPQCCTTPWSSYCVSLAEQCGVTCQCDIAPAEQLSCSEDADCAWCDDENLCNGQWRCEANTCTLSPSVTCSPATNQGCLQNTCQPETGLCALVGQNQLCDDAQPCTSDSCGSDGGCVNDTIPHCGTNHPCEAADTPGSADSAINSCVCESASNCCDDSWGAFCVSVAQTMCGLVCDCAAAAPEALNCVFDSDCNWCVEDNPCNGTWQCVDGSCTDTAVPMSCAPYTGPGCFTNQCVPLFGECTLIPDSNQCDDGDYCTQDTCGADGTCSASPIAGCGENGPCQESSTPGSSDPAITACVCEQNPFCCDESWDSVCVTVAIAQCGETCEP